MPAKRYWRIAGQAVIGHVGAEPTTTPGEAYGFRAILTDDLDPSAGVVPPASERANTLRAYGRRAGEFVTHEIENGRVAYTETHDGGVPGGSLVINVRPSTGDCEWGHGGWYLVESVEDATVHPESLYDLALSIVYLAPLATGSDQSGYQTRDELASALEAPTLI